MQKTHVVFGESIEGAMQLLQVPDPTMGLTDDLSAGPLGDMLSEGTGEERVQWWTQVLALPNPRYLERLNGAGSSSAHGSCHVIRMKRSSCGQPRTRRR